MDHQASIETSHGSFEVSHFCHDGQTAVILRTKGLPDSPFLRIHSSCVFSESFSAIDCDCALQLDASLAYAGKNGGIVIYLYQEGRGIGLDQKIQAIAIQQQKKVDTATAFKMLGHAPDPRDYSAAIEALSKLNIKKVHLATRNPLKINALKTAGIEITKIIKLEIPRTPLISQYIDEKSEALGHKDDHDNE